MEHLSDENISEQINENENKIKVIKEKIRLELQVRRDLKNKIRDAKNNETIQIVVLERLDEYEAVINKQIAAAEKMEDSDSLKQRQYIKQYEIMLKEQQAVWAKYEEEYEKLPLSVERNEAEQGLLKVQIQNKLLDYRLEEAKRMAKLKKQVEKRKEQLKIIEFAKLCLDHYKRQTYCKEMIEKIQMMKIRVQDARLKVERLEKQDEERRSNFIPRNLMADKQIMPQIDLSHFKINKRISQDQDNASVYSFVLEQEYMDTEDKNKIKSTTEPFNTKSSRLNMNEGSLDFDSEPMDIEVSQPQPIQTKGSDEYSHFEQFNNVRTDQQDSQGSNSQHSVHSNYINGQSKYSNSQNANAPPGTQLINKKFMQDYQSNNPPRHEDRQKSVKRGMPTPYMNGQQEVNSHNNNNFANDGGFAQNTKDPNQRPIPTPAKLQRRSNQENPTSQTPQSQEFQRRRNPQGQQQNRQSHEVSQRESVQEKLQQNRQRDHQQVEMLQRNRNSSQEQQQNQMSQEMSARPSSQEVLHSNSSQELMEQQNIEYQAQKQSMNSEAKMFDPTDLTRLPHSNTPRILANERANFKMNIKNNQYHIQQEMPMKLQQPVMNQTAMMETPKANRGAPINNECKALSPSSMNNFYGQLPYNPSMTPISSVMSIDPTSMLSTSLNSGDANMMGDNISGILSSEASDIGDLTRQLYEDSDMISENGDYENLFAKFRSPNLNENRQGNNDRNHQNTSSNAVINNQRSNPQEHQKVDGEFPVGAFGASRAPMSNTKKLF